VIDQENLNQKLHETIERFVENMTQVWVEIQKTSVLDLRQDPRPWHATVRAANTNGSILLDRYVCLLAPESKGPMGLQLAIAWLILGVVTENSELFSPPR
jgi:hypothetical protein